MIVGHAWESLKLKNWKVYAAERIVRNIELDKELGFIYGYNDFLRQTGRTTKLVVESVVKWIKEGYPNVVVYASSRGVADGVAKMFFDYACVFGVEERLHIELWSKHQKGTPPVSEALVVIDHTWEGA